VFLISTSRLLTSAASIGGYFSEPASNFPSVFSPTGLFAKFPYLLPNIICAALLLLSIIMAYFLLEETHPDKQPRGYFEQYDTAVAETPLLPAQGATADSAANLTADSYGTFNSVEVERDEIWRVRSNGDWVESPASEKVFTRPVIMFVIALGIFTYHSVGSENCRSTLIKSDHSTDDIRPLASHFSSGQACQ
jgi:hypothetical protein